MKKIILFTIRVLLSSNICFSLTHTITNSGTSFSPSTLTINIGDTVNFVLASIHNAREVNQTTWDANQSTSNGGFETPLGGGIVVLQTTGTHYYVCVTHAALGMKGTITVNPTTEVSTSGQSTPAEFALKQNYPNPFNPSTIIKYEVPSTEYVSMKVYDMLGQVVATLVDEVKGSGNYTVQWDASSSGGLPSGIYFYQLNSAGNIETKRMMLVR